MKIQISRAQRLVSFIVPLVAGALAASPSRAASIAYSQTILQFDNFSHSPYSTETYTAANTLAIAKLEAETTALASVESFFAPDAAGNFTASSAFGEGQSYYSFSSTTAQIIGNFLIHPGEFFTFDFRAFLTLNTSVDNPNYEQATAAGKIAFFLFGTAPNANPRLLDSFSLDGYATTPGTNDFLTWEKTSRIRVSDRFKKTRFKPNKSLAIAEFQGLFKRFFRKENYLTLVAVNESTVAVPEPTTSIALPFFVFMGFVGFQRKQKTLKNRKPPLAVTETDSCQ